jgi:hypothetical protein
MPLLPPTRTRYVRVSGLPGVLTIYGTFSSLAEVALRDGWLSIYEREYLKVILPPGAARDGDTDAALDLIEALRQVRVKNGYRPKEEEVDDLHNFSKDGNGTIAIIANYWKLNSGANAFAGRFTQVKSTPDTAAAATLGPARLIEVGSMASDRIAAIIAEPRLAPDDKTVLAAIQIITFMAWLFQPTGGPPVSVPLTMGNVTFNVPPLNDEQQQAYKRAWNLDKGSLIALKRLAQEILNPIFVCAGVTPSWWQWPAMP